MFLEYALKDEEVTIVGAEYRRFCFGITQNPQITTQTSDVKD